MYESLFHLRKSPFTLSPDPSFLFNTDGHREALAGLYYSVVSGRGFAMLTGEVGTGKTTIIRRLLDTLKPTGVSTSLILNPALKPDEMLETLLMDLDIADIPASKPARLAKLNALLLDHLANNRKVLLIVDEAQRMSVETLDEIRLIANFETNEQKLLQVILVGHPELSDLLNQPDLRQLKQRIAMRLHLGPLTPTQVTGYIGYRWLKAGGDKHVPFTAGATELIAELSTGIPRLINSLCDAALLSAYAENSQTVDANMVRAAAHELLLTKPAPAPHMETHTHHPAAAPAPVAHTVNGHVNGLVNGHAAEPHPSFEHVSLATLDRLSEPPQSLGRRLAAWFGIGRRVAPAGKQRTEETGD